MKSANRHRITTALFCAGFVVLNSPRVVIAQSGSAGGSIGNDEKSLSGSRETSPERPARKPTEETHRSRPSSGGGGRGNFDGPWAFTSTGCSGAGTTVAVISGGQFATQFSSGAVSPNGMIHSAGGSLVGDKAVTERAREIRPRGLGDHLPRCSISMAGNVAKAGNAASSHLVALAHQDLRQRPTVTWWRGRGSLFSI